jgi:hypothetical protein
MRPGELLRVHPVLEPIEPFRIENRIRQRQIVIGLAGDRLGGIRRPAAEETQHDADQHVDHVGTLDLAERGGFLVVVDAGPLGEGRRISEIGQARDQAADTLLLAKLEGLGVLARQLARAAFVRVAFVLEVVGPGLPVLLLVDAHLTKPAMAYGTAIVFEVETVAPFAVTVTPTR